MKKFLPLAAATLAAVAVTAVAMPAAHADSHEKHFEVKELAGCQAEGAARFIYSRAPWEKKIEIDNYCTLLQGKDGKFYRLLKWHDV